MAMRLLFGFETGLKSDYWAWTGTHYVSSGDEQKVLPAWSNAHARSGSWSVQLAGANEQIECDPLMALPDLCWYTFGIRFSSVTPGGDSLFLQIRNEEMALLDVLLTPQSRIRVVRSGGGGGGGGGQGISDITSSTSVQAGQWHLIQIEIDFEGPGPSSTVRLYIDSNAPDVESTSFDLDAAPREARFVHNGVDYTVDDVYINDFTGRCTDIKPQFQHFGILRLGPMLPETAQNFTDSGTDLHDEIDEVPWPPHSPDPPCEAAADAAKSTPNEISKLIVSLEDPPQLGPIGVSALIQSKEQHASTLFEFGVELDGKEEVNAVNDAIVCWLTSAAMFASDPNGWPWTFEAVERLRMVFRTDGGPDRFTIEAAAVEYAYSVPAEVVEVHPLDADFSAGNQGKIMISTRHDDQYHTTKLTTAANTPAQTRDQKVTISAYVTPVVEGVKIYFEVIDPDDPVDNANAAYEEDSSPLSPFGEFDGLGSVDSNPNDNRDSSTGKSMDDAPSVVERFGDGIVEIDVSRLWPPWQVVDLWWIRRGPLGASRGARGP